ncbi:hypothetical protein IW16_16680 [Chryseobacterium vrystaatense]|uniref:Uncharacterized protein n=1 Tax=Chryseobacterium vrystaatense TaxID=307480 RepID=A0ABR4UJV1_9FLAO|nr:hypothetical protein IW16_16680 [Chryseobacterium vrystaatense]
MKTRLNSYYTGLTQLAPPLSAEIYLRQFHKFSFNRFGSTYSRFQRRVLIISVLQKKYFSVIEWFWFFIFPPQMFTLKNRIQNVGFCVTTEIL